MTDVSLAEGSTCNVSLFQDASNFNISGGTFIGAQAGRDVNITILSSTVGHSDLLVITSSDPSYGFLHNPRLPSNETIRAHCLSLRLPRGTTLVDPETKAVIAWVKCGPYVTIDEARTQDWTAKALVDAGISDLQAPRVFHAFTTDDGIWHPIGYIVMEYIEGVDCDFQDVDLVAKCVQTLMSLQPPPGESLGHIGGGTKSIVHSFFPEWLHNADYRCDQDFYRHIKRLFPLVPGARAFKGDLSRYDRFLCLSDFNSGNFRKRTVGEDGRVVVVALDFRATCFMPLPFIEVALKQAWDPFCQLVARKVKYTPTEEAKALLSICGPLVQYGPCTPLALPRGVCSVYEARKKEKLALGLPENATRISGMGGGTVQDKE